MHILASHTITLPDGREVAYLGDPHLGREFKNNVALDRRGEREQAQWAAFERSLNEVENVEMHVCPGDLFDKFVVPLEVIFKAAEIYRVAALKHPDVHYVILRGNHDMSRFADKVSAFDMLERLLIDSASNITCVVDKPLYFKDCLFVPCHPFKTAAEVIEPYGNKAQAVFGHWETQSFGGEDENLMPYKQLALLTDIAVTGHIHTPDEFKHETGLNVLVTGSMLPYSHAEDPKGDTYVTLTLLEYETTDPDTLKNKCVRVLLQSGEDIPEAVDCLQFSVKKVKAKDEQPIEEVKIAQFDFKELFFRALKEVEVDDDIQKDVWDRYQEESNSDD
jgi:DNA repair exonuclease SbcCD nuclease subunit